MLAVSAAFLFLALPVCSGDARAQDKNALVGTWAVVSSTATDSAGKKIDTFGPKHRGTLIFAPNGRYAVMQARGTLPKFAANARTKGSAEENQAVVAGTIAHFGRYTIDDGGKSFTFHIEASTFPNWDGTQQKRPFEIKGDRLIYKVAAPSAGTGAGEVVWKRVQ